MERAEHMTLQERKAQTLMNAPRVGVMGDYEVLIFMEDECFRPHVHVIDMATYGEVRDVCICLQDVDYAQHSVRPDACDAELRAQFADFMHQPSRNVHYRNHYEMAVNLWNDNNTQSYVQIQEDSAGRLLMPDYTHLSVR
jgi:hypothetical protein